MSCRRPLLIQLLTVLVLGAPLAAHSQGADLGGAKFEGAVQVAGTRLPLNGAGIRYKAVFKVYAAALYLGAKATTPEAVITQPGPRRLQITMLRDIDANELGKLFTRGMEQNAPREELSKSLPGIMRMSDIFSAKKKMLAGEGFAIDWIPGTGTVILVNGKPASEPIKEPEFYAALMSIWLGKQPADAALKDALLGKAPAPAGNRGND